MHPILFKFGSFYIGTYGVILAIAVFFAILIGRKYAPKEGIDKEVITDFYVYSIVLGFVGSKIALIITDYKNFSEDPIRYLITNIRYFGAFYGGFLFAFIFGMFFIKRKGLNVLSVGDVTVVSLSLGQAIGRWGCFFAGCCYGAPTELPWGMVFPAVDLCASGTKIHPWPIYEFLLDIAIFFLLIKLFDKRIFLGQNLVVYLLTYSTGRFFLEFLRGDDIRGLYFKRTLSFSQIVSILIVIFAIPFYFYLKKRYGRSA